MYKTCFRVIMFVNKKNKKNKQYLSIITKHDISNSIQTRHLELRLRENVTSIAFPPTCMRPIIKSTHLDFFNPIIFLWVLCLMKH